MLEDMVHTVLRIYVSVPSEDAMAVVCDSLHSYFSGFFFFFAFVLHQTFLYKSYS